MTHFSSSASAATARCAPRSKATGCATIPDDDTLEIDQPRIRAIGERRHGDAGRRRPRAHQRRRQRGAAARRCPRHAPRRRPSAGGDRVPRRVPARLPQHRARALAPAGGRDAGRRACSTPKAWTTTTCRACVDLQGPQQRRPSSRRSGRRGAMSGPLVFITGASSGIGQALAARFHAPAVGWRWSRAAPTRSRTGPRRKASRRRAAPSTAPTCATSPRSSRRARACIAAQGLPDVVIANAGISVGMDTGDPRRPRGDARDLRDQQPRPGRDLPSVRRADVRARQRHAGGHRQRRRHPRPARARRLFVEQGGGDQSIARACAARCGRSASRW